MDAATILQINILYAYDNDCIALIHHLFTR